MIKCLSVRQPWAWLLIHGGKDIENRSWPTKVRGRVLIHAAKGMTGHEWLDCVRFCNAIDREFTVDTMPMAMFQRGGIIGSLVIDDCVEDDYSPWFVGPFGFHCRDAVPLPFIPYKGMLGFFDVPESALGANWLTMQKEDSL